MGAVRGFPARAELHAGVHDDAPACCDETADVRTAPVRAHLNLHEVRATKGQVKKWRPINIRPGATSALTGRFLFNKI